VNKRIAVLGAGPMGLAVAYQLVLDGYCPVIFEADDRIGGMSASFDFYGLEIERYYHFHCISDNDLLQVLNELGLSEKMIWVETKMGYWFRNRLQPWGNPMALLRFRGLSILAKIRYALHAYLSTRRNDWQTLDQKEAVEWIRAWVGSEAYEVLWNRLFELKFYEYTRGISAAWIWSRIKRIGQSRYNILREKLGYLDGGSSTLLNALKSVIESNGGQVRLSSPVKKIVIENGKVSGVETPFGFESFETIISTVPLPYVSKLIPDLPIDILSKYNSIKNIGVVCVIAKLRKSVSDNFWLNINDPEMDIPGIIEYTNLRPLKDHVVYAPFYMPGTHSNFENSDEAFIGKVKRYLIKINPTLSDEDFIHIHASRYRHAQPICECGHLQKLPPVSLPVDGLYVADTSYYYPEDRGISESIGFGRRIAKEAQID